MKPVSVHIEQKCFAGQINPVIERLKLDLQAGTFSCLIGPSGVGKSTILNIVAGLDLQFEGKRNIDDSAGVGFIFQEPRLMPWLNVRENIALVCADAESGGIDEMLYSVGLEGSGELYPSQLSGGMQRRVALARAFIVKPDILLLDEPFVSLDAPSAHRLRARLEVLWQLYRPTVLFVTHSLPEAICMADRLIFLSDKPARIIHDATLTLPRPREIQGKIIQDYQNRIFEQFPEILSGRL